MFETSPSESVSSNMASGWRSSSSASSSSSGVVDANMNMNMNMNSPPHMGFADPSQQFSYHYGAMVSDPATSYDGLRNVASSSSSSPSTPQGFGMGLGGEQAGATGIDAMSDKTDKQFQMNSSSSPVAVTVAVASAHQHEAGEDFTWDVCLVFKTGNSKVQMYQETKHGAREVSQSELFTFQTADIVQSLRSSNLRTTVFINEARTRVFVLAGATEARLKQEAARIEYDLKLDRESCVHHGASIGLKLAQLTQNADPLVLASKITPESFDRIYGVYTPVDENTNSEWRQELYQKYSSESVFHQQSIFRTADRLKLTLSIIESPRSEGGAGQRLEHCVNRDGHALDAYFPLHERKKLSELVNHWQLWKNFLKQPLDEIRDYMGEQIAYYFAFLEYYNKALILPAFVGFIIFLTQISSGTVDVNGTFVYGLLMAIWSSCFLEIWKRQQTCFSVAWGTTQYSSKEQARPDFKGEWQLSPIDGRYIEVFPRFRKLVRSILSQSVVTTMIGVVIACVVGIFVFRKVLVETIGSSAGAVVSGIVNAFQIQVLNYIYGIVANWLTNFENHRTQSQWENSLIAKTFMFKFVNSYNSLFYIAFFKQFDSGVDGCTDNQCSDQLGQQLATIYISMIVFSNGWELLKPFVLTRFYSRFVSNRVNDVKSNAEEEYELNHYQSTFEDFDEMAIQFGFVTLFVVAFPLTPLLALINNFFECRLDAIKISKLSRRPFPRSAVDIGTWSAIMQLIANLAVVTNVALVCFETKLGRQTNNSSFMFILFITLEHSIFVLKWLIDYLVPDEPLWVTQHKLRQEHVVNVLILGAEEHHFNEFNGPNVHQAHVSSDDDDGSKGGWRLKSANQECVDTSSVEPNNLQTSFDQSHCID